jgi:hypothetical protein
VAIAREHRVALMGAVAVIAAVGAHLPGRFRHAPVMVRRRRRARAPRWTGSRRGTGAASRA